MTAPGGAPAMGPMGGTPMMMPSADANRDGFVTADEAAKHAGARFDRMDKNKDGVLDETEFMPRGKGPKAEAMAKRHASAFKAMDKDGDGKVSREEFLAHHAERFKAMDQDGDGKIPAQDYRKGMQP